MGRIPEAFRWLSVPLVLLAAGCAVQGPARLPACPGKASVQEALSAVSSRVEQAVAFRASGQCRLAYYVPDDDGT